MSHYEVEIKSLLGGEEAANNLRRKMSALDPSTALVSRNSQLNHYFEGGDIAKLKDSLSDFFDEDEKKKFADIIEKGNSFSVRTREKDGVVLLVVKASIDEGTSSNTVSRLEFEEPVKLSLTELDQKLVDAGFRFQAKWSRDREEYKYKGANVCIDRNAGYGYLAEFEKVVQSEDEVSKVRSEIESLMKELEISELPQDRLERMFAHYNAHWADYYGTDKVFTIE